MRMSLPAANPCLAIALVLALAACRQEAPPEAPAPVDAPSATASDQAIAAPGPAASTGDEALEGDVIASTNEPFWQASVTGATLTLRGIGSERSVAVTASEVAGDTRSIRASDASGVVELQVIAAECQDTMAGAKFPLSAVLAIDGEAPVNGCARPAWMPPPGEPQ